MALAHALGDLAADRARVRRLGDAARADVRERFAAKRLLDEIQALYDELIANPPPHRVSARPRLSA
jgi:glycosyltransferase involved in cell wall biosynthesis